MKNPKSRLLVCFALSINLLLIKTQCTSVPSTAKTQKSFETPNNRRDTETVASKNIKISTPEEATYPSVSAAEISTTKLNDDLKLTSTMSDENVNFTYDEKKFLEAAQNLTHLFLFDDKRREDAFLFFDAKHHPFAVVFITNDGRNTYGICSGTLVAADWVLTAAHCLVGTRIVWVYGGLLIDAFKVNHKNLPPRATVIASREFYMHPNYNSRTDDYDLGLIKLRPPFTLNEYTYPLRLADSPWPRGPPRTCVVTAFGSVYSSGSHRLDHMRKTQLIQAVKPCPCEGYLQLVQGRATDRHLCLTRRQDYGTCAGNSGSGLVCNFRVCGVTSYGIKVDNCRRRVRRQACGSTNTLSVFQDVYPSLPWIRKYVPPWTLSRGRGFNDQEDSKNMTDALSNTNSRHLRTTPLFIIFYFLLYCV